MAKNIIEIVTILTDKTNKPAKKIVKTIETLRNGTEKMTQVTTGLNKKFKNLNQSVKSTTRGIKRFQMNLLSVMFLGMALQRFFGGILRAAVTSFTKIMESNNMLGTAIQRLAVHWEYLKFIMGSVINSVIEPFLPLILGLIGGFTEFIQKNSKLVAWVTLLGFTFATLLFLFGMLGLGINGLLITFPLLGSVIAALLSPFSLIIGAILILMALIPSAKTEMIKSFESIGNSFEALGKGFLAVVKGDMELAKLYAVQLFLELGDAVGHFSLAVLKTFNKVAEWLVNKLIEPLLWVLKIIDKVAGTNTAGSIQGMVDKSFEFTSKGLNGISDNNTLAENHQRKIDEFLAKREWESKFNKGLEQNKEGGMDIGELNITLPQGSDISSLNNLFEEAKEVARGYTSI